MPCPSSTEHPAVRSRAFTIAEMVVVLVLLGILAALAVPTFASLAENSRIEGTRLAAEAIAGDVAALVSLESGRDGAVSNASQTAWDDAFSDTDPSILLSGTARDGSGAVTDGVVDVSGATVTVTKSYGDAEFTCTITVATLAVTGCGPAGAGGAGGAGASVPDAPTGVAAVAGDTEIAVSWTAPADDGGAAITGYTATSTPGSFTCTATAPATTCTITGLTNGTEYTVAVVATNSAGPGPAATSGPATPEAPAEPLLVQLTATAGSVGATPNFTVVDVERDTAGNLYVAGSFTGQVTVGTDTFAVAGASNTVYTLLVSYTSAGVYRGAMAIPTTSLSSSFVRPVDLALGDGGRVYVTGTLSGGVTADFDPTGADQLRTATGATDDIFLAAYQFDGSFSYVAAMLVDGGTSTNTPHALTLDGTTVYLAGATSGTTRFFPGDATSDRTSGGGLDAFVATYGVPGPGSETAFTFLGAERFGSTSTDRAIDVAVSGGNVYLTGIFRGTVDFDPGAGTQTLASPELAFGGTARDEGFLAAYTHDPATKTFTWSWAVATATTNVHDNVRALTVDGSGNLYLSASGTPNSTTLLRSFDSTGAVRWSSTLGGTVRATELVVDGGVVYVTGEFEGTADLDPGAGVVNLVSGGSSDTFAAAYSATTGAYEWAQGFGGTSADGGVGLTVSPSQVYVAAYFLGSIDVDPGVGTSALTAGGSYDGFVAAYARDTGLLVTA